MEVPLKKRIIRPVIFTSLCSHVFFFANIAPVFGQTDTGRITGTVTEPTGGVVAGAKIAVKSADNGSTRETTTNSAGIYTVPGLKPDTYDDLGRRSFVPSPIAGFLISQFMSSQDDRKLRQGGWDEAV